MLDDEAYVEQHREVLSNFFGETVAALVEARPADPVGFLKENFVQAKTQHGSQQNAHAELERFRALLERERAARRVLDERIKSLERAARSRSSSARNRSSSACAFC